MHIFRACPLISLLLFPFSVDPIAISELYNPSHLQCKTCGLRLATQDLMSKHLDWHFKQNRGDKRRAKVAHSQPWFVTADEWVQHDESRAEALITSTPFASMQQAAQAEATEEQKAAHEKRVRVPADESQTDCAICGDAFEQVWDDDEDSWLYKNTIRVPDPTTSPPSNSSGAETWISPFPSLTSVAADRVSDAQKTYQERLVHFTCFEASLVPSSVVLSTPSSPSLSAIPDVKSEAVADLPPLESA